MMREFAGALARAVSQSVAAGCRLAGRPLIHTRHMPAAGSSLAGMLSRRRCSWAPATEAMSNSAAAALMVFRNVDIDTSFRWSARVRGAGFCSGLASGKACAFRASAAMFTVVVLYRVDPVAHWAV